MVTQPRWHRFPSAARSTDGYIDPMGHPVRGAHHSPGNFWHARTLEVAWLGETLRALCGRHSSRLSGVARVVKLRGGHR